MSNHSNQNEDYTNLILMQLLSTNIKPSQPQSMQNIQFYNEDEIKETRRPSVYSEKIPSMKLMRTHSKEESEKMYLESFKLFYNAITEGVYDCAEIEHNWEIFELISNSPSEMQEFLKQFNHKKESILLKPTQIKHPSTFQNKTKNKANSKSLSKDKKKKERTWSSLKYTRLEGKEREQMRKEMSYICKIIEHGEKFIHS